MRLIDADRLVKDLKFLYTKSRIPVPVDMRAREVLTTIMEQPTAYDIDKVVEQLIEEKELSYADFDKYVFDVCPGFDSEYDDFFHKGLERAIELIKVCSSKYLRS